MSVTKTTCAYCGVGCGVLAETQADGQIGIKGDPHHPANFGRLCTKGQTLGETVGLEGRLLHPQIAGVRAEWVDATQLVADKFRKAIAEYGPESVEFYVSGQLLTEDYYVANKLMKGFMGSANIDTNSRLCMASSVAGHKRAFGADTVPGTYADLEAADLIILTGSNLAWCHPVLHQRILAAKEKRGTQIINIDPRRTATSDMADLHLGLKAGGDTALFTWLLAEIRRKGVLDTGYVEAHVTGAAEALDLVDKLSFEEVIARTGLGEAEIEAFVTRFIETERVVTIYSQGVNQASDGADKVNAILNCHLAMGRIGGVGQGPFSVTGQPNAMGGREVGGLANMLACHLDIENAEHRTAVQEFWDAPKVPEAAGLKAVDLFDACASGQIKALWIMCTNPAVSLPRAGHVADAIRNVDFVAVSDIMEDTDTTRLADVLLPATGWGEKDGTVTNSERRISRQRGFLPAPAEARHDWQIICDVAKAMGFGHAFDFATPAEVFAEYAKMTYLSVAAGRDLDLTGLSQLTEGAYDRLEPVQWPVRQDKADTRFFAEGGFFTPDGKARMLPIAPRDTQNIATADFPFVFNTGRVRDHWHTMTRSAKSATLSQHLAEPYLEVHPLDAEELGLAPSGLARVSSPNGAVMLRVWITDRVAPGTVFAPLHWTSMYASNGRVDKLVNSLCDPVSGQPELKRMPVAIQPEKMGFFAFALSTTKPTPDCAYWAMAETQGGWRIELAEKGAPLDAEAFLRAQLGVSGGDVIDYHDLATGQHRLAVVQDGRLIAALFSAPEPVAASRAYLVGQLGSEIDGMLLAGRASADRPDPGPILCNCFSVGVNTIASAISSGKALTLDQIGATLQAGTNCGSCRPELSALIKEYAPKLAAE